MSKSHTLGWKKLDTFVVVMFILVSAFILLLPDNASGQSITINDGTDTYVRELPQTVSDGQQLTSGLANTLNAVIAEWEKSDADAVNKVRAIIEGNHVVLKDVEKANGSLKAVAGGVLAKNLAVGIYSAANPLGSIGGYYGAGGASVTWNVFNMFELNGRAGVAWSPQVHPEVSLAAEWWIF